MDPTTTISTPPSSSSDLATESHPPPPSSSPAFSNVFLKMIREKIADAEKLTRAIARKESEAAEKDAEIARKDILIAEKEKEVSRRDADIAEKESEIRRLRKRKREDDGDNAPASKKSRDVKDSDTQTDPDSATTTMSAASSPSKTISTVDHFCQTDDAAQAPILLPQQQTYDQQIDSSLQSGPLPSKDEHIAYHVEMIAPDVMDDVPPPRPPPPTAPKIEASFSDVVVVCGSPVKKRSGPVINFFAKRTKRRRNPVVKLTRKSYLTSEFTNLAGMGKWQRMVTSMTAGFVEPDALELGAKAINAPVKMALLPAAKEHVVKKKTANKSPAATKIKNVSKAVTKKLQQKNLVEKGVTKKTQQSQTAKKEADHQCQVLEDNAASGSDGEKSSASIPKENKRHESFLVSSDDDDDGARGRDVVEDEGVKPEEANKEKSEEDVTGDSKLTKGLETPSEEKEQKDKNVSEQQKTATVAPKQKLPQLFALGAQKLKPSPSSSFLNKPFDITKIRAALEARKVKKPQTTTNSRAAAARAKTTTTANTGKSFGRLPMSLIEPKESSVEKSRPRWMENRRMSNSAKTCKVENEANKKKPSSPNKSNSACHTSKADPQPNRIEKEKDVPIQISAVVEEENVQRVQENGRQGTSCSEEEKGPRMQVSLDTAEVKTMQEDLARAKCNVVDEKVEATRQGSRIGAELPEEVTQERDAAHLEVTETISTAAKQVAEIAPAAEDLKAANQTRVEDVKINKVPNTVSSPAETPRSIKAILEDSEQLAICLAEIVPMRSSQPATLLEEMLEKYRSLNASKVEAFKARKEGLQKSFLRETLVNCLRIQLGRLWTVVDEPTFHNIVDQLSKPEFAGPFERLLFDILYMAVLEEKPPATAEGNHSSSSSTLFAFGDGVAALTAKQIKVISLLDALSKTEALQGVGWRFSRYFYYSIFGPSKMYNMKGYEVANVVRFYLTLLRQTGNEEGVRIFLYDIFFFRSARNHVFVCILLDVWPEVLYWHGYRTQEQERTQSLDPVVETVVWLIFHEAPSTSLNDLRVHEARKRLKDQCNVRMPPVTAVELVQKFIGQVLEDCNNEMLKEATTKSLLLLAKVKDYRWANNSIQALLVELLGKYKDKPDLTLWMVETISTVSRVYPKEGRECLVQIFEGVEANLAGCLDAKTQNVRLAALLRLGHHLQVQVAEFLSSWKPPFPLSPDVEHLLVNYLGTRGRKHGETTIIVQKKKRIFAKV